MRRLSLLALAVLLLALTSCGTSEPNPVVVMETSAGNIKIELFLDKAPITVNNFLQYVDDKHYEGTIFHRVIADFMIQGGGFTPEMREKPTRGGIRNEGDNGVSNKRGTIAMARTSVPDSATAQFFINVVDNSGGLDRGRRDKHGYAVFGKVLEGMDVVDQIRDVRVHSVGMHENVPVTPVIIKSVRRVETKKE